MSVTRERAAVMYTTALRRASNEAVGCSEEERFLLELEFVQCLSSPQYLNWLAQHRYFEDPAFVDYLAYLQYWKQPEYARRLVYPHSLFFLDMLQDKTFRTAIARSDIMEMVHSQQFYFWQHYRQKRLKDSLEGAAQLTEAKAEH